MAPTLWSVFPPDTIKEPTIVAVPVAWSTVKMPPIVVDPLMFPMIFPVTVKSPGIAILLPERIKLFPDNGFIVFTLNVLIFLYYKITSLEPVPTVIEPEL